MSNVRDHVERDFPAEISLGGYILERLRQLQVTSLFGVPGDFNLTFLDLVEDHQTIEWVGNANELNAGYAVDGNARVKRGVAALVTTFGVGELSALNGIAGCYSERIPVLHIVGVPSVKLQEGRALLHHTLGDGNFRAFQQMSAHITCKNTFLYDASTAAKEVDDTLVAMLTECRPAYLTLPTNLVHAPVSTTPLKTSLPPSVSSPHPLLTLPSASPFPTASPCPNPKDPSAESAAVEAITALYAKAKHPVILVDALAERLGAEDLVLELVEKTWGKDSGDVGMTVFVSPMGKGTIDESHPAFGGVYAGSLTLPSIKKLVEEEADLVIHVGPLKSDFNTGSFSYKIKHDQTIELQIDKAVVGYAVFPDVGLRQLLPLLATSFSALPKKVPSASFQEARKAALEELYRSSTIPPTPTKTSSATSEEQGVSKDTITHEYLWPRMSSFFREGDVVVGETGTTSFGILDSKLPKNVSLLLQVLWGSIGWSVGAALGAAFAAKEQGRRSMLFVGDGSLQLTVQEIGTMVRHGLTPIIFVLNNDGYEIERQIHGPTRIYNNVPRWNHQLLLSALSPSSDANAYPSNSFAVDVAKLSKHKSYRVSTRAELDELLKDEEFASGRAKEMIQLVEIVMPRGDAPRALVAQAKLSAKANEG